MNFTVVVATHCKWNCCTCGEYDESANLIWFVIPDSSIPIWTCKWSFYCFTFAVMLSHRWWNRDKNLLRFVQYNSVEILENLWEIVQRIPVRHLMEYALRYVVAMEINCNHSFWDREFSTKLLFKTNPSNILQYFYDVMSWLLSNERNWICIIKSVQSNWQWPGD